MKKVLITNDILLLTQFIKEEKLDIVDTSENIVNDVCNNVGFASNMYKSVIEKIILLPNIEECNDEDYKKIVFYNKLIEILE